MWSSDLKIGSHDIESKESRSEWACEDACDRAMNMTYPLTIVSIVAVPPTQVGCGYLEPGNGIVGLLGILMTEAVELAQLLILTRKWNILQKSSTRRSHALHSRP